LDINPQGFDELHVSRIDLKKGETYSLEVKYVGTLIVLEGCGVSVDLSSKSEQEMEMFSTWYVVPKYTSEIRATSEKMVFFIADPL
jgi:hypothetical protein